MRQLVQLAIVYSVAFDFYMKPVLGQLAEEASLQGGVDQIILTGGIAYSQVVTDAIAELVDWIAPVTVYPGEDEMEALAMGVLRVISGGEEAKDY